MYPFLDGDTSWKSMTDKNWKDVGTIFKRIHEVILPPEGFESLRKETFDPTEYTRWAYAFETQHTPSEGGSVSERALRSAWMAHQPAIHTALTSLEKLAGVLQERSGPQVICHADLHPGNLLRDRSGQVFVIDWVEVMLAPKERDFIFVGEPQTDGSALQNTPPFFQGYGQTEIDWIALTYYRYERVVQDLIACAQEVFFRDDLGEETKADSVQLFHDVLAEGSEVDAAYAAEAHIPSDITFHHRKSS